MASTFTTSSGTLLIIPDSSVDIQIQTSSAGLATAGVVAIVGEANEGPSWSQDKADGNKLSDNAFSPTDIQRVMQKYGSGRLVDAFRGLSAPSASPRIQGSAQRVIVVKTNDSAKASRATLDGHGTFTAKRGGQLGNEIQEEISSSQAESAPTTSSFSYVPSASSASLAARINGGAKQTLSISANTTPDSLASSITANIANLNAVGGVNRVITQGLSASDTLAVEVVSGQNVKFNLAAPDVWGNSPAIGDTVRIASGSVVAGGSSQNVGWYLVTAVSNTTTSAYISATKITAGAPVAVVATAFSATPANDIVGYSSMRLDNLSGTNRSSINAGLIGINITASASSAQITATLASGSVFASTPRIGDLMFIPSGSVIAGAGNANVGWYSITEISNNTSSAYIKASRLSNGNPVAVSAVAIVAITDLQVYDKQIKGAGKSMEIMDNAGTVNVNTLMLDLGVNSAADFLESLLVSSAERKIKLVLKRSSTSSEESYNNVGGNIAMLMGYNGTTASLTIQEVSGVLRLQTSVTGGIGAALDIDLNKISSINDLITTINANAGYSASAASALDGGRNPSILDHVSAVGIASDLGNEAGRVKRDIWDLNVNNSSPSAASALAEYTNSQEAGLPEDNNFAFLSGGSKGGSTGLSMANAIDALQGVRCNFVVPLVSQDASDDIDTDDTESSSTYTVDAVNAAVKAHCISMSTPKIKRHRIGIVSKRGSFADAKASAATMANFRIAHLFQDASDINSSGDIEQFQPWMASVKAAGMQAAGSYKPIFNKTVNIVKAIQAAGDFDDENVTDCEDAILAGLIPIQKQETGGYVFLTDQTTYGLDNNIVYNSIQAVYISDLMALSLAQSLKTAFVGESVADVTASTAESFVKAKMSEFLFLKFTVGTKLAPSGWKSIAIRINGNVLEVDVVAVLATGIKFVPITLSIEGIKSSNAA
jgi:hypothetical protein